MPRGARSILVALIVVACGCAGGSAATVVPTTVAPTSTAAPRAAEDPTTLVPTTNVSVVAPEFSASAEAVTATDLGPTWREGCPVGPDSLRRLTLAYWGFDDAAHVGTLVINADVADSVTSAFRTLYEARFPIRQMVPVDVYGGSDDASLAADNTAGFNCRAAVADGPPTWSQHAYGLAIDVDPLENPSVLDGQTYPPDGAEFLDRTDLRRGMATADGPLVQAFAAIGWGWGGVWRNVDYQHFSRSGT